MPCTRKAATKDVTQATRRASLQQAVTETLGQAPPKTVDVTSELGKAPPLQARMQSLKQVRW